MDHGTDAPVCHPDGDEQDDAACEGLVDAGSPGAQEAETAEDSTVESVLSLIGQIESDAFDGVKPARRRRIVAKLIARARDWGMTDPRDIAVFCALCRHPGDWFFQQPAWLEAAERVKNAQTTWTKVFQEPQIWP